MSEIRTNRCESPNIGQLSRLENLKNSKNLSVASETILDTILDAINYSLMTTLYMSHGFWTIPLEHKELCYKPAYDRFVIRHKAEGKLL